MAGYYMVIYLAALQNIPPELYEAAAIDGANRWQQIRYVTVPLISPTTFFISIMCTMSALKIFEQVYVMTGGGPANSTITVNLLIYRNAFEYLRMGRRRQWRIFSCGDHDSDPDPVLGQKRWVHYG